MKIGFINTNNSFKGYDARELKGVICTDKSAVGNLPDILTPLGVDIYYPNLTKLSQRRNYENLLKDNHVAWAQDYMTILKGKKHVLLFDTTRPFLSNFLHAFSKELAEKQTFVPIKSSPHIRGGNFYICQKDGKNVILMNEIKNYFDVKGLKTIYQADEVIFIPALDYHTDLFLRPLDNGNILVADIKKTREGLVNGKRALEEFISSKQADKNLRKEIEKVIGNISKELEFLEATLEYEHFKGKDVQLEKTIEILKAHGFNPIMVPANYYLLERIKTQEKIKEDEQKLDEEMQYTLNIAKNNPCFTKDSIERIEKRLLADKMQKMSDPLFGVIVANRYFNNFANAIVLKKDGELHYITNAPLLDKRLEISPEIEKLTGFSTKNLFIESVSPFVKKENIHFIDEKTTKKLFDFLGGIHCAIAEAEK